MIGSGYASDSGADDTDIGIVGEGTMAALLCEGVCVGSRVDPEGFGGVRDGKGSGIYLYGALEDSLLLSEDVEKDRESCHGCDETEKSIASRRESHVPPACRKSGHCQHAGPMSNFMD